MFQMNTIDTFLRTLDSIKKKEVGINNIACVEYIGYRRILVVPFV